MTRNVYPTLGSGGAPIKNNCSSVGSHKRKRSDANNVVVVESRMERTRILLFIKILLRCLEKTNNAVNVICQVKAIVSMCVKRNKLNDDQFVPLGLVVETMLQELVDDSIWKEAKFYQEYYSKKNKSGGCCGHSKKMIIRNKRRKEEEEHQRQQQQQMLP